MKVGFYAPLKEPGHRIPSGDREMANLLIRALQACGYDVDIISKMRSWEGSGDLTSQREIYRLGQQEFLRILDWYKKAGPPDLIFTYHVYHKAPDWIGAAISKEYEIPYVIAEISIAPKQDGGPWDMGYRQTLECLNQASAVISLNPGDCGCVEPLMRNDQQMVLLRPFLDIYDCGRENSEITRQPLAGRFDLDSGKIWLITVAMMRAGDKMASYSCLAESIVRLKSRDIQQIIIGDGDAREDVERAFAPVSDNCVFTGELATPEIRKWLNAADIFVWPAVNEAYGIALLEAVAAGLPAVVQDYGGVRMLVDSGINGFVVPQRDGPAFDYALEKLINDRPLRKSFSSGAVEKFRNEHQFDNAVRQLKSICDKQLSRSK
jgi:glycosyltransferase involved in cell wall biosynthesis